MRCLWGRWRSVALLGQRPVSGLPVDLGQPWIGQIPGVDPGADHRGQHSVNPVAFPCGGGGVDDVLHVAPG